QRAFPAWRAAVMERLDIRWAAGQQQPVERGEDGVAIGLGPDRRDQQRQAAHRVDDRVRIAFVDRVEGALVDRAQAARDANQRQVATGHLALLVAFLLDRRTEQVLILKQPGIERYTQLQVG